MFAALASHRNPMLGWIVRLAIETGMRAGEIGNLRLNQIDLQRRTLALTKTKNGSTRTVPLTMDATAALGLAIAHPGRPPGCDLVFFGIPSRSGSSRPYGFLVAWWKLKRRLGLNDLHFHDLRHEAISRLVEGGLSDQQVASISGHRSMQMLKRYTHLRAEELVSVLDHRRLPKKHPCCTPPVYSMRTRVDTVRSRTQAISERSVLIARKCRCTPSDTCTPVNRGHRKPLPMQDTESTILSRND